MPKTTLHIKNMVCPRCITAVEDTLKELNIKFTSVKLGEAEVFDDNIDYNLLDRNLKAIGFELINNDDNKIIEIVKTTIINIIHHSDGETLNKNFSKILSDKTKKPYTYISNLFSKKENITIEKYIILQKIEKVKELISYKDLSFSEIAYKLNYSSPAHLSTQFKKIMGCSLSEYKKMNFEDRQTLDKV